jgi:tetratricopeptide (TPR) repeat protein
MFQRMMKKARTPSILILLLATLGFASQDIKSPNLTPAPQTDKHRELLREAVRQHDKGSYDGAIATYLEILKENPDDVSALYELGFSYSAKGDYQKSLDIANRGAQYKSDLLPGFYTLMGNDFDHLGQAEKAIKVYREGIKQFPTSVQLHYNLAIALVGVKKVDEAKKSFKDALLIKPDHPSSHFVLSQLYQNGNYKIPALLAACRFLVLEPRTVRSASALKMVEQLIQGGAQQGTEPNKVTIFLEPGGKTDEGDFNAVMTALSLLAAARYLDENKNKTEIQLFVNKVSTLLAVIAESVSKQKSSGFAWDYYRPYFSEMANRKFVEPFCYYISQSNDSDEVERWLTLNAERVREFLTWSNSYQWAKR